MNRTANHDFRVMREGFARRFGVSYINIGVSLKSSPAIRAFRKDYYYVSELVTLSRVTNGQSGADMVKLSKAIGDAYKVSREAMALVLTKLADTKLNDEMPVRFKHDACVASPVLMRYLETILLADKAFSGLSVLQAYGKIEDREWRTLGRLIRNPLFAIKTIAMGLDPKSNKTSNQSQQEENITA